MRRLLMLAIAASLLLPALFASSVAAAPQKPALAPPVTTDVEGNCVNGSATRKSGMLASTSSPSQSRSGVSATLDLSDTGFDICNNYIEQVGVSAWVAIQPKDTATYGTNAILQIGTIECGGGFFAGFCQGENNPHYVWAVGGCAQPQIYDLGAANYGSHTFTIYKHTDGVWYLQRDGSTKATIANNDVRLSCWINSSRMAVWAGERWDVNDSVGDDNPNATHFYDMRFGVYGQGWFNPLFADGECHVRASDDVCLSYAQDNIEMFTYQ